MQTSYVHPSPGRRVASLSQWRRLTYLFLPVFRYRRYRCSVN